MRLFMVIAKYLALLFVWGAIALFALLVCYTIWYSRIPSDSEVQQRFDRDKSAIVELLNKLSQEPASIVGVTKDKVMLDDTAHWVAPEKAGFSSKHFTEYEVLMHNAHVLQVWRNDGETNFAIAGWGFASEGWRLSYAYVSSTPTPLVPTIDNPPRHAAGDPGVVYRPLGDNWYIRLIY